MGEIATKNISIRKNLEKHKRRPKDGPFKDSIAFSEIQFRLFSNRLTNFH